MAFNKMANNTVLVVSATEGFLAKSLVTRMTANKIKVVFSTGEIRDIEKIRLQIELIILFTGDGLEDMADTLVYLKDIASDHDVKFILIGEESEIRIAEKIIPDTYVYSWFNRPLNMDELIRSIQIYLEDNEGENKKKTVLIVDDDITYMRTVYEWLKDYYHVGMASNGVQAIRYLSKNKVDLVLLDYEMPIANGPQVLQMLKDDNEMGQIPVMFLTGHGDRASVMSVMGLCPADYLLKTIDRTSLVMKLHNFFLSR